MPGNRDDGDVDFGKMSVGGRRIITLLIKRISSARNAFKPRIGRAMIFSGTLLHFLMNTDAVSRREHLPAADGKLAFDSGPLARLPSA